MWGFSKERKKLKGVYLMYLESIDICVDIIDCKIYYEFGNSFFFFYGKVRMEGW